MNTMAGNPEIVAPYQGDAQQPTTLRIVASCAFAVASIIHLGAAYGHRKAGSDHVAFFIVAAGTQALLAGWALRSWDRRVRSWATLASLALLGTWLVSRTAGLPHYGKEEVGLADALAAAAEVAVLALVALPDAVRPATRRVGALVGGVALLSGAIALPSAARGHAHSGVASAASISAVWAGSGHVHGALTGNGIVHDDAANCSPTSAEVTSADKLVAATSVALRKYDDVNVALKDGFVPIGFEPNGLFHYINRSYAQDSAALDPARPESIVYGLGLDRSLTPVGVMYMMSAKGEHGPKPGGCLMTWHTHGFPFAKLGEESVEMVHVWTVPVPGGPFAHEAGPDWARLFLGRTPVDPAEINRLFATVETMVRTKKFDPLLIVDYRALAQPMAQRCNAAGRASMARLRLSATLQQQFCDPLLGAPVPGAEKRSALSLLQANATN
jgi:hypothetical protein